MDRRGGHISTVFGPRFIVALGVLFTALGLWRVIQVVTMSGPIAGAVDEFILIGMPGLGLVYGGYWVLRSDLHPDVYPNVAAYCLGGLGVMLVVVVLLMINPAGNPVDRPVRAAILATAIGSIGGLAVGINKARAVSRTRELEETVEQLELANRRLEQSNQRLEQFAYAASHDLQEPLRMVSSYLQLLESRYKDELDEDAEEFIDYAVNGADRMRAMVESLLEYSRITTSSGGLEPTDTEAVLEDVLEDLQLQIEETGAMITRDDLPTVTADPDQLAQVFQNLLQNALKYSGDRPPRVHVSAEWTGDEWRFSVADEGIGIGPEYHDRIFKVFKQLHTPEDEAEPGAGGIGLALCERIIERHGGEIWVESGPGEGATFYFTIPQAEAALERTGHTPDGKAV